MVEMMPRCSKVKPMTLLTGLEIGKDCCMIEKTTASPSFNKQKQWRAKVASNLPLIQSSLRRASHFRCKVKLGRLCAQHFAFSESRL